MLCYSRLKLAENLLNNFRRMASTNLSASEVYEKAEEYWANAASDVDGMLGGFERLHSPDINDSKAFIHALKRSGAIKRFERAIDCGSGIGRITKHLLLPAFQTVDMVDVTDKFITQSDKYIGVGNKRVGNKYVEGLQSFELMESYYDCIWNQWVLSHLTDEDCLKYFERCVAGLRENGVIVVKENHASGNKRDFDTEDHSWTRIKSEFVDLFDKANLEIVLEKKQKNFPKGMYDVFMYALKPKKT